MQCYNEGLERGENVIVSSYRMRRGHFFQLVPSQGGNVIVSALLKKAMLQAVPTVFGNVLVSTR